MIIVSDTVVWADTGSSKLSVGRNKSNEYPLVSSHLGSPDVGFTAAKGRL